MKEYIYTHKAHYYETDQMGIIHHSNYIRWMEEARIRFLEDNDMGYKKMEEAGYISPVLSVSCEYKEMIHFNDNVIIKIFMKEYNGLKFTIGYNMYVEGNEKLCTTGTSTHCFLHTNGRPVMIKKELPEFDSLLREYM